MPVRTIFKNDVPQTKRQHTGFALVSTIQTVDIISQCRTYSCALPIVFQISSHT